LGDLRIGIALPLSGGGGKRLGNPNIDAIRDQAVAATKAISDRYAENTLPIIRQIQASGAMSLRAIADLIYTRDRLLPHGWDDRGTALASAVCDSGGASSSDRRPITGFRDAVRRRRGRPS
jgi:hypothetical protein